MYGNSDPENKKAKYAIMLNKGDEELMFINYLKNEDLYGIQFKDMVDQYVVVENNNLKEFASKIGIENTENIPNKIENINKNSYYEDINKIFNKYLNITIDTIPDEKYSKIEKTSIILDETSVEANGYQIKLKKQDVQAILIKLLENAENDKELFNLINNLKNKEKAFVEYQTDIKDMLEEISTEISNEENTDCINISIYKQGNNTIKMLITITRDEMNQIEISLDKTANGFVLKYITKNNKYGKEYVNSISIKKVINTEEQEKFEIQLIEKVDNEETENYNLNFSRQGGLSTNSVIFNASFSATFNEQGITLKYKNKTDFTTNIKIEDFASDNHLIINGLSSEQLNNLFTNLGTKINKKLENESIISSMISLIYIQKEMMSMAKETMNNVIDEIEREKALLNDMIEIDGQMYSIDDVANGRVNI